jgi:hypothetical protein
MSSWALTRHTALASSLSLTAAAVKDVRNLFIQPKHCAR